MSSRPTHLMRLLILGHLCLLLGLLLHYALPPLIERIIDQQISLTPHSRSYPMWREPPVPIYQRFYFYNVTNAQEVEARGSKPQLQEVGPFTYRSVWQKRDLELDAAQELIQFKHVKQWIFEPELSVEDEQLQLVTLNTPLAITLSLIQSASNAVRLLVTFSLDGLSEGFFTKRSVKQLLFDGYPDLLTTFGPLLNAEMLSQGGHFGYMSGRNNNIDATYEINTGVRDIGKLNTIERFNGRSELPYWYRHHKDPAGNKCNSLEGATTGEMFPPASSSDHLKLFQPDLCRVWRLNYDSPQDHSSGLRLRRYLASRDIFRNASDLPENSCYFKRRHHSAQQEPTNRIPAPQSQQSQSQRQQQRQQQQQQQQNQEQHHNRHSRLRHEWPAGVFTLAPCKFNAPIYVSMPHFLDADPHFNEQVSGLQPDPERHEFYLDLEPRTGSPVVMSARVQLNVAISKPPGLVRFRNIPEIMFPVFWQELSVNLTGQPEVIQQLLVASRYTQEATRRISWAFLILGAALLTTALLFYLHHLVQRHRLFRKPGSDGAAAAEKPAVAPVVVKKCASPLPLPTVAAMVAR